LDGDGWSCLYLLLYHFTKVTFGDQNNVFDGKFEMTLFASSRINFS